MTSRRHPPPENKKQSSVQPIRTLPMPEVLILPLQQHIGQAARCRVAVGETVLKRSVNRRRYQSDQRRSSCTDVGRGNRH